MDIAAGKLVGVIGPIGVGKSTLLAALDSLQPCRGVLPLRGQPLPELNARERARRLGHLAQARQSAWALAVENIVAMGQLAWADVDTDAVAPGLQATSADALVGRRGPGWRGCWPGSLATGGRNRAAACGDQACLSR